MSYVASRKTLVVANHLIQPIASYILYNIATVTIAVMLFSTFYTTDIAIIYYVAG